MIDLEKGKKEFAKRMQKPLQEAWSRELKFAEENSIDLLDYLISKIVAYRDGVAIVNDDRGAKFLQEVKEYITKIYLGEIKFEDGEKNIIALDSMLINCPYIPIHPSIGFDDEDDRVDFTKIIKLHYEPSVSDDAGDWIANDDSVIKLHLVNVEGTLKYDEETKSYSINKVRTHWIMNDGYFHHLSFYEDAFEWEEEFYESVMQMPFVISIGCIKTMDRLYGDLKLVKQIKERDV